MSPVTEAHLKSHTARYHQRTAAMRWLLNFLIGVSVALVVSWAMPCSLVVGRPASMRP